jgi:predicted RNA binding protein YcfA (HicA-like mRNA interferase family)
MRFLPPRSSWPATPARQVYRALLRIGWSLKRQRGSHRVLARSGLPDFVFAFHDDLGHSEIEVAASAAIAGGSGAPFDGPSPLADSGNEVPRGPKKTPFPWRFGQFDKIGCLLLAAHPGEQLDHHAVKSRNIIWIAADAQITVDNRFSIDDIRP